MSDKLLHEVSVEIDEDLRACLLEYFKVHATEEDLECLKLRWACEDILPKAIEELENDRYDKNDESSNGRPPYEDSDIKDQTSVGQTEEAESEKK